MNSSSDAESFLQFKHDHWMVFEFERSFNYYDKRTFLKEHMSIPVLICAVYVSCTFAIQHAMRTREAFSLKRLLIVWNLCLAIFSVAGSFRVVPFVLSFMAQRGLHESCCVEPFVNGVYGFWCWLFILSKLPELGDTMFVVLRKQKLIFLHWFHHASVLMFVWISNSDDFSIGGYFMAMNFAIHSLMYSYFTLKAMGYPMPRACAMSVTLSQVVQMVVGLGVTLYAVYEKSSGRACATSSLTISVSLALYGMYLLLFLNFFLRSYTKSVRLDQLAPVRAVASLASKIADYKNNNSKTTKVE